MPTAALQPTLRHWSVDGLRRYGLLAGFGLALALLVPSSQASEFAKFGTPLTTPVDLHDVALIHDAVPQQYEAYAVGETASTHAGVILRFNGQYWSNEPLPAGIGPLRGVAALRYADYSGECYNYVSGTFGLQTVGMAVGDNGTILYLNPSTKRWEVSQKQVGSSNVCPVNQVGTPACESWAMAASGQAVNLRSVAIRGTDLNLSFRAIAVGDDPLNVRNPIISSGSQAQDDAPGGYCASQGAKRKSIGWSIETSVNILPSDDLYAVSVLDYDHWWVAGQRSGNGLLLRYRPKDLYTSVNLGGAAAGQKFLSLAPLLRNAKTPTATDPALASVVWVGTESGSILRYDEDSGAVAVSSPSSGRAIRDLTLTRRQSGSNVNLLRNGTFDANRGDFNSAGQVPDGWRLTEYSNELGASTNAFLIPSGYASGNPAYVGEIWEPTLKGYVRTNVLQFGNMKAPATFPYDPTSAVKSPGVGSSPTLGPSNAASQDISGVLVGSQSLSNPQGEDVQPSLLNLESSGLIYLGASAGTRSFKINHPFGRIAFNIENDTVNGQCSAGTVPVGTACSDDGTCGTGGVCSNETTRYASHFENTSKALAKWTVGQCKGNSNVACFDDSQCKLGTCSIPNSGETVSPCYVGAAANGTYSNFVACTSSGATCVPWSSSDQVCVGSSTNDGLTTVGAAFPASGGNPARICLGGTNQNRSCSDDSQCPSSTCGLVGSGWYPFSLRYSVANVARCKGTDIPCLSDSACRGAALAADRVCENRKWCVQGSVQKIGQPCTLDTECGGGSGLCQTQYQPGTCYNGSVSMGTSCLVDRQCGTSGQTCRGTKTVSPVPLTLMVDQGSGFVEVSNGSMAFGLYGLQTEASQTLPLTQQLGQAYRVSGHVKIDFLRAPFDAYTSNDPRQVSADSSSTFAGVLSSCSGGAGLEASCGYDLGLATSSHVTGVTGTGTCGTSGLACQADRDCKNAGKTGADAACINRGFCGAIGNSVRCNTSQDCLNQGQTGSNATCVGDWISFSYDVAKQNRNLSGVRTTGDDSGGALNLACVANYGTRVSCDDLKVTPLNDVALPAVDQVDVWAASDSGGVYRRSFDFISGMLPAESSSNWRPQLTGTTANLEGVSAADPSRTFVVGTHTTSENATLLRLTPGNVNGWGWIGGATSTTALDPLGWIDFNCGNLGSCIGNQSSFGVNANIDASYGNCQNDVTKTCTSATADAVCGAGVPCLSGVLTGSAWIGNQDANDTVDAGPCQNYFGGNPYCNGRTCSNDQGRVCRYGPVNTDAAACFGTCAGNAAFRCTSNADCQISCSANPLACKAVGWMSFDKRQTGTPPVARANEANLDYLAQIDRASDQLNGWTRIQLGRCDSNPGLACYQDSNCPGVCSNDTNRACYASSDCDAPGICRLGALGRQICNYSGAPAGGGPESGWVSLHGPPISGGPFNGDFYNCQDCSIDGGTGNLTCKFCTAVTAGQACNACGTTVGQSCTRRCSLDLATTCKNDTGCSGGKGRCQVAGRCVSTASGVVSNQVCFDSSVCGANSTCQFFGTSCTQCNTCSGYGVNVDLGYSRYFFGYAWSPDFGWIDLSRVHIGGQLFFQSKYGDIYSGQDIGSPLTGRAPGYPGGTSECNATYRIIAGGTITNFCTAAHEVGGGVSYDPTRPYIQPGAQLYPLPRSENRYTSQLGSVDVVGLTAVAKTVGTRAFNKYGQEVVESNGDTTLEQLVRITCTASPCPVQLGGRVFHVKATSTADGNLTIDREYSFSTVGGLLGAGTIVADGDVHLSANLSYGVPQGSPTKREELASVAFVARGVHATSTGGPEGILIDANVTNAVGAYFTEKDVAVSSTPPDNQLTISGLMIARSFDFRRKFQGLSGASEPAERIIYDGRIQANTPPGFASIPGSLPNLQEVTP